MRFSSIHGWLIVALSLVVSAPVIWLGVPDWGNDGIFHAQMTREYARQFWNGDLWPRWTANTNAGFGSPTFYFLPVFSRLAVVWLDPLFAAWDPDGMYLTAVSLVLAMVLGALATWRWCRDFSTSGGALFAAVIFTIQPYHLAVNLYTRAALGELWGNVWPPLILLAQARMASGGRLGFPALALSYGLLVLNHLPTTVCFSLLVLLAPFLLQDRHQRMPVLFKTLAAMLLGMVISGTYLVPALLDQNKVFIELNVEGMFQYFKLWLFRTGPLLHSQMRLMLLAIATLVFAAVCAWLAWRQEKDQLRRRQLLFLIWMTAYSVFFSSQLAAPFYAVLKPLQQLQFPTRFLQVLVVSSCGLAAISWPHWIELWRGNKQKFPLALAGGMVVLWLVADLWGATMAFSRWRPFEEPRKKMWAMILTNKADSYVYLPRTAPVRSLDGYDKMTDFARQHPPKQIWARDRSGNRLTPPALVSWQPREIRLRHGGQAGELVVNHFYYPQWKARRTDTKAPLAIGPDDFGMIRITAPAGDYEIAIELESSPAETMGDAATAIGLLAVGGLGLRGKRRAA